MDPLETENTNQTVEIEDGEVPAYSGGSVDDESQQVDDDFQQTEEPKQEQTVDQEKINQVIGMKHRQMMEAKERAEAAERKIAELEERVNARTNVRPVVPPLPDDPLADDYALKVAEREKAIIEQTKFDLQQNAIAKQQQTKQQQIQNQKLQEAQQVQQSYIQNAQKLNIDPVTMQNDAATVAPYLKDRQTENWVMGQPDGPAIVQHLAQNINDAVLVSEMTPIDAAIYLRSRVQQAPAQQAAPVQQQGQATSVTSAPAPGYVPPGRGKVVKKNPYLSGVQYLD